MGAVLESVLIGRAPPARAGLARDGLARMAAFDFLEEPDLRLVGRIQARSYANLLGLLRFTANRLDARWTYLHLESVMGAGMPAGYRFLPEHAAVAGVVRCRSAWSVLALAAIGTLGARAHYRQSIAHDSALDALWKDVILFHWREESRHSAGDERAWLRENALLDAGARDYAVGDLIVLLGIVEGILEAQARADASYFSAACGRRLAVNDRSRVEAGLLHAYRWQHLLSGVQAPHFGALLSNMLSASQYGRLAAALAPLFSGFALQKIKTPA
jgi:hypothetical protein